MKAVILRPSWSNTGNLFWRPALFNFDTVMSYGVTLYHDYRVILETIHLSDLVAALFFVVVV